MHDIMPRYGEATGRASVAPPMTPSIRRTNREVARAVHQEHSRGVIMAARVNAGAHVARTALINVALLSREEEQLIQLAPLGEGRYKAIIDVYAIYAAGVVGEL